MATITKPPLNQEPSFEPNQQPPSPALPTVSSNSPRPPEPSLTPDSAVSVANVPSYARWFSFDGVHKCEVRFLPEFFDSRSPSKNPRVYMYYRNSIVERYRDDFPKRISFTEVRRTLVGDVGSIRRVFDFLDGWGLINYSPPATNKAIKWDEKDMKGGSNGGIESGGASSKEERVKRSCNHCKSVCSIACFVCDKNNTTLCARCYVRGNYQLGDVSSSDFRRVEISEDSKSGWSDRENLNLLEAVMHYGDDWRKVARLVGRGEKECVSHFIKLPFGEEFSGFANSGSEKKQELSKGHGDDIPELCETPAAKRICLSPLADASNPIMAQVVFLSALAGVDVAEASAQAAVAALTQADDKSIRTNQSSHLLKLRPQETVSASNGNANLNHSDGSLADAKTQLEREEHDIERAITGIVEVQMKEIKEKIDRFEALELEIEKEWQQLDQMKNLLFVDQLTLIFHKNYAKKTGEKIEGVKQN